MQVLQKSYKLHFRGADAMFSYNAVKYFAHEQYCHSEYTGLFCACNKHNNIMHPPDQNGRRMHNVLYLSVRPVGRHLLVNTVFKWRLSWFSLTMLAL